MLIPSEKTLVTAALEDVLIHAANPKGKITTIFSPDESVALDTWDSRCPLRRIARLL